MFKYIIYVYIILLIEYNKLAIVSRPNFYKADSLIYYDKLLLFRTRLILNENESFSETTYSIFELGKKWDTKANTLDNMINKTWKLPDRMVPTIFVNDFRNQLSAYIQIDKDTWFERKFSDSHIYSLDFDTGVWKSEEYRYPYLPTFKDIKMRSIELNKTGIEQAQNSVIGASFLTLHGQFENYGKFVFGGLNFIDGFKSPYLTRHAHIADYRFFNHNSSEYLNLIPPSAFQTATQIDNRIIILGGIKYQNYEKIQEDYISVKISKSGTLENTIVSNLEIVYIFDVDEDSWSIQKTKNFSNKSRIGHTATYVPKLRSIFVYGGTAGLNRNDPIYNDLQVLNIDTWEWSSPTLSFEDQTPIEQDRAWHTSQLIQDKILYFYGDIITNNDSRRDILILDLKGVQSFTKAYQFINTFGPFNNLTHISTSSNIFKPKELYNYYTYTSWEMRSSLVMGVTFGIAGGITLALLAFFLIWRFCFLRNNYGSSKNGSKLSLILPDALTPRFTDAEHILDPFKGNEINTNQKIWELDSNYAYSIEEPDIKGIMNFQSNSKLWIRPNSKDKKDNALILSDQSQDQNQKTTNRRWSSEMITLSKAINEISPNNSFNLNTTNQFNEINSKLENKLDS